ncbi:membrane hypothetical protein [Paraburkholderia tropica]|uniref:hypothetical protein n=1 Tax=Paraburkholderia tropica TaxID=92647 RepID=UPI001CB33F9C|nr:hypothetical protein [Paraburkholderia tropica]CAG9215633.1 membrane hypothetical protein [Paraburkholderia tropica]
MILALLVIALVTFSISAAAIFGVWCVMKAAARLPLFIRRIFPMRAIRFAYVGLRRLFRKVDHYLFKICSEKYVQIGAGIAFVAELLGILGVRAHGPILNVLSLIWTSIFPVAIVFHLAYRVKKVKKFCDDAAVRLLVTVVLLLATWYSHAMAASTITTLMGVDSSRFTSAVAATTFFGVVGLAGVIVAGASGVLLLIGMFLTFFPARRRPKEEKAWAELRGALKQNGPRVLPLFFFMVTVVAMVPEAILGGSNFTAALAARIAFTYDLADPEMCGSKNPRERFLVLLDRPSRAIRYTAPDLPRIPVTFLNKLQIETIMPIEQEETDCRRS